MSEQDWLAQRFEEHRRRLRAVAYRMLGSVSEADDAVQEAWLRLSGADPGEIENLSGWLTTVVARVSLNMLRSRAVRREEPMGPHLPDPIVDRADGIDPEHEALLADSVGLALFVVLETLTPPERLAFVLHDMFAVPFEEIAPLIGRSPQAARQLASRARRRVRARPTTPDADVSAQRETVNAFLAAAREGDFDALVATLDPDVVLRADGGPAGPSAEVRGAQEVARRAVMWSRADLAMHPALVNGAAGTIATRNGVVFSIASVLVRNGKIAEMDLLADPERLARLDLTIPAAAAAEGEGPGSVAVRTVSGRPWLADPGGHPGDPARTRTPARDTRQTGHTAP
jgi:RNA polymerase sigma factor (sigma-70 family)